MPIFFIIKFQYIEFILWFYYLDHLVQLLSNFKHTCTSLVHFLRTNLSVIPISVQGFATIANK